MSNQKHELKILPEYFQAVWDRTKTFEIRKNDRSFSVGDTLVLKEWTASEGYTGSAIVLNVTYLFDDLAFLKEGYVILGLSDYISREGLGDEN
ncbi:ASCH/PUA domain-containing protein [Paenibacillus sp. UMB4589-SE434]|uniref:ASCH/PUA domain-containing protein n=1 Tax=Paenibacillus sp. UMB4589-SE434 TaxID=3046314 RepID=UPI00254C4C4E|nr:ASCH/PUA domain-containing protein [Paenibacillus sp. UMB4589-SE434]MDK8182095.1 ASCH/PUA domain-containing protein [Paenibacillus sp. UMB4589-SE434]